MGINFGQSAVIMKIVAVSFHTCMKILMLHRFFVCDIFEKKHTNEQLCSSLLIEGFVFLVVLLLL